MRIPRRALLSVATIGTAAGMASLGTFATFTDTASGDHQVTSGTVDINLAPPGGPDNRLSLAAGGLVPGDAIQRRLKLINAGNQDLASVTLTTTASPSSLLDTDATNGLQVKIEKCTGALGWTESASAPYTYTCDGVRTTVLARRAVIGSAVPLSNLASTAAGSTDDMVITVDLPSTANNDFQTLTSTIRYAFNATQRVAGSK